jgi:hypothetical protein
MVETVFVYIFVVEAGWMKGEKSGSEVGMVGDLKPRTKRARQD